MAATGITAATGTAVWDTAQPKTTTEVATQTFQPAEATVHSLVRLGSIYRHFLDATQELLSLHDRLFTRTVCVEWEKKHTRTVETCTGTGEDRTCTTRTEVYWTDESSSRTLVIDQDMTQLRQRVLHNMKDQYATGSTAVGRYQQAGLRLMEGAAAGVDFATLNDRQFAEHFEFDWQEGRVGTGWQVFLASIIGLPASAFFLFYKKIYDNIAEASGSSRRYHSGYRHRHAVPWHDEEGEIESRPADPKEIGNTRRAFFQMFLGTGAAVFAFGSDDYYQRRSDKIRGKGVKAMRDAVVRNNGIDQTAFFESDTRITPMALIKEAREHIEKLAGITEDEVDKSIRNGLRKLDEVEDDLRPFPIGTRSVRTTRKDNQHNKEEIERYVETAHKTAEQLSGILEDMEDYFANGVPAELLPAMRAWHITQDVNEAVSKEHTSHMWGLAGDLAKLYGLAMGLLLVTEIPAGYHERIYNFIQGLCDFADRKRMSAFEILTGMKSGYSKRQMRKILEDKEILAAIAVNLRTLNTNARDLAEARIVTDPAVASLYDGMESTRRVSLADQINQLGAETVAQAYVDKALAHFMKVQLGTQGFLQAVTEGRDREQPFKRPSVSELRDKVLELVKKAGATFIFDLIEADLIDDNEPGENWITAEPNELPRLITYWADRVAGYFAASQNLYAALGILDSTWFKPRNENTTTRVDILEAFQNAVMDEISSENKKRDVRAEIETTMNERSRMDASRPERVLDDAEIAQRLLLRRLQNAVESHGEFEVLVHHSPKLRSHLATPS